MTDAKDIPEDIRKALERYKELWPKVETDSASTDEMMELIHLDAFLKSQTMMPDPTEPGGCFHCGQPAEYFCDFVISEMPYRTCDRSLCEKCRTTTGKTFVCQRSGKGKGCTAETIDYCKGHATMARAGVWFKPPFDPIGGPKRGA